MDRFILKKLTVSGGGHKDSVIEFYEGFNLIIGPSNTGKSLIMDCIDYAFGFTPKINKPSKIVDNSNGYTHVTLELKTDNGYIILKREIGTTKVSVLSDNSAIENGTYSSDHNAKKSINDIFLRLIGINDTHKVLSSQKGNTQSLTWRSILHLFFIKQNNIDRESSSLIAPNAISPTASGAALLYLLTGKDANELKKPEDPNISKAKRDAIIMYIRNKKDQLSVRREKLEAKISNHNIESIKKVIASINKEIDDIQNELNSANVKSKKIMSEIYSQNSKLSECNTVLYNFDALDKQFQSDVRRLGFIVNGQIAFSDMQANKHCPFCDSELQANPPEDYLDSVSSELTKLNKHLSQLQKARSATVHKKKSIETKISDLEVEKSKLDKLINISLKPKLSSFREELNKNLNILKWKNELDIIHQDEIDFGADLFERETEEEPSEVKFNIFSYFNHSLISEYENELQSALEGSKIGGASTSRLNMKSFDIEIDNKSKATSMGGGYCAILNAITAFAMGTFIYKQNGFAPGFFVMDSALTQLSEADYVTDKNSVKHNFMNYMLSQKNNRQIIMIEQKDEIPFIPESDSASKINVIEFSRNPNFDRYGFLNDVFNPEHK